MPYVGGLMQKGRILPDVIQKHPQYHYEYLNENTQQYMLEKMQELLDLDWLQYEQKDLDKIVLATLLDLDKLVLQRIQDFDFTKQIPKLLVVDCHEAMFSLKECIFISFLNLIGFDIAVFTPTGYRNLEKYISPEAYESYTIGEFEFNVTVPELKPARHLDIGIGLLGKLFRKGRN